VSQPAGNAKPARTAAAAGTPAKSRALRARGELTMRSLLDAGARAFATKGYYATRVDDIVKLARTSHGTFYLYFSNKEELFRTLADEVAREMGALAQQLGPLTPDADGRAALRAWIERFADLYENHGAVIQAWTEAEIGSTSIGHLATEILGEFTQALADRIADVALADRALAELDPKIAALALVAMLERLNSYVLSRQVRVTRAQMVDTLTHVTCAALFARVPD
jgi:AcrR family transcriptional regulator